MPSSQDYSSQIQSETDKLSQLQGELGNAQQKSQQMVQDAQIQGQKLVDDTTNKISQKQGEIEQLEQKRQDAQQQEIQNAA